MDIPNVPAAMSTAQRPLPNPEEWTALRLISPIDHPIAQLHLLSPRNQGNAGGIGDESSYGLLDVDNLVTDTTQLFGGNGGDPDTTLNRLAQQMVSNSRPAASSASSGMFGSADGVDVLSGDDTVPSSMTHSAILSDANAMVRALSNRSIETVEPSVASLITALSQRQQQEIFTDGSAQHLSYSAEDPGLPVDWSKDVQRVASSLTGFDNFMSASRTSSLPHSPTVPTMGDGPEAPSHPQYHSSLAHSSASGWSNAGGLSNQSEPRHGTAPAVGGGALYADPASFDQVRMVPGEEFEYVTVGQQALRSIGESTANNSDRFPLRGQEHSPTGSATNISAATRPLGEGEANGGDQAGLFRNYLNPSDAGLLLAQYIATQQQHTLGARDSSGSEDDYDTDSPGTSVGEHRGSRRPLSSPLGSSRADVSSLIGTSPSPGNTPPHGMSPSCSGSGVSDVTANVPSAADPFTVPRTEGVGVGFSQPDLATSADSETMAGMAAGHDNHGTLIENPPWRALLRQDPSGQPYDRPDVLGEVNVSLVSSAAPATAAASMSMAGPGYTHQHHPAYVSSESQAFAPGPSSSYSTLEAASSDTAPYTAVPRSAIAQHRMPRTLPSTVPLAARFDQPIRSAQHPVESAHHVPGVQHMPSHPGHMSAATAAGLDAATSSHGHGFVSPGGFADMHQHDNSLYSEMGFGSDGQFDGEDFVSAGVGVTQLLDADEEENAREYQFDPAFIDTGFSDSGQLDFSPEPAYADNAGHSSQDLAATAPTIDDLSSSAILDYSEASSASAAVPSWSTATSSASTVTPQKAVRSPTAPSGSYSAPSSQAAIGTPTSTEHFADGSPGSFQAGPSPSTYFAARSSVLGGLGETSAFHSDERPHFDMGHPLFSPPAAPCSKALVSAGGSTMFNSSSAVFDGSSGQLECSQEQRTPGGLGHNSTAPGGVAVPTSQSASLSGLDASSVERHVRDAMHVATPRNVFEFLHSTHQKPSVPSGGGGLHTTSVSSDGVNVLMDEIRSAATAAYSHVKSVRESNPVGDTTAGSHVFAAPGMPYQVPVMSASTTSNPSSLAATAATDRSAGVHSLAPQPYRSATASNIFVSPSQVLRQSYTMGEFVETMDFPDESLFLDATGDYGKASGNTGMQSNHLSMAGGGLATESATPMVTPGAIAFPSAYLDGDSALFTSRDSMASSVGSGYSTPDDSVYRNASGRGASVLSRDEGADAQFIDREDCDDPADRTLHVPPGYDAEQTPLQAEPSLHRHLLSTGNLSTLAAGLQSLSNQTTPVAHPSAGCGATTSFNTGGVGTISGLPAEQVARAISELQREATPTPQGAYHVQGVVGSVSDSPCVTLAGVSVSGLPDSAVHVTSSFSGQEFSSRSTRPRDDTPSPSGQVLSASVTNVKSSSSPVKAVYSPHLSRAVVDALPTGTATVSVAVTVSPAADPSPQKASHLGTPKKTYPSSSPLPSPLQRIVQPKNIEKWLSELLKHSPGSSPRTSPKSSHRSSPGSSPKRVEDSTDPRLHGGGDGRSTEHSNAASPTRHNEDRDRSLRQSMSSVARNLSDSFRQDGASLLGSADSSPAHSAPESPTLGVVGWDTPTDAAKSGHVRSLQSSASGHPVTPTTVAGTSVMTSACALPSSHPPTIAVAAARSPDSIGYLSRSSLPTTGPADFLPHSSHCTAAAAQSSFQAHMDYVSGTGLSAVAGESADGSFSTPATRGQHSGASGRQPPSLDQTRSSLDSQRAGPVVLPDTYAVRGIQCMGVPVAMSLPVRNTGTQWIKASVQLQMTNGTPLPEDMLSLFQVAPRMTLGPLKSDDMQITCLPHAAGSFSVQLVMTSSPVIVDGLSGSQDSLTSTSLCTLSVNALEPQLYVVQPPEAVPGSSRVRTRTTSLTKSDNDLGQTLAGTTRYHPVCLRNPCNITLPVRLLITTDQPTAINTYSFVASVESLPFDSSELASSLTLSPPSPLTSLSTVACTSVPPCRAGEYFTAWLCFKAPAVESTDLSSSSSSSALVDYSCSVQAELDVAADFPLASVQFTTSVGWARLHAPRSMQALTFATSPDKAVHRTVPLRNVGNVACQVQLSVTPPSALFSVQPTSFAVLPQQEVEVNITFLCSVAQHSASSYLVMGIVENSSQYELLLRGTTTDHLQTNGDPSLPPPDLAVSRSFLSCNTNQVTFDGVPLNEMREENLILCNTSYSEDVLLEISVPGHADQLKVLIPQHKITSTGVGGQTQPAIKLSPQERIHVGLRFTASELSAIKSSCLIRDLKHAMKFQIPVFCYGGQSDIEARTTVHSNPLTKIKLGQLGKQRSISKLLVENRGKRDGFAKILCYQAEDGDSLVPAECLTVSPVDSIIPAGKSKQFLLIVDPTACNKHPALGSRQGTSLATLCLYSGDELARCRWRQLCRTVGEASSAPNSPTVHASEMSDERSQPFFATLGKAGLNRPIAGENLELAELKSYGVSTSAAEEQELFERKVRVQTIQISASLPSNSSSKPKPPTGKKKSTSTTTASPRSALGDVVRDLDHVEPVSKTSPAKSAMGVENEFDLQHFPPPQLSRNTTSSSRSALSSVSSSQHMTDADWLVSPTLVPLRATGQGENVGSVKIQNLSSQPCRFGVHWPGYLLTVSPDHGAVPARGSFSVSITLKLSADISYPASTPLTFTCGRTRKDVIVNIGSALQSTSPPRSAGVTQAMTRGQLPSAEKLAPATTKGGHASAPQSSEQNDAPGTTAMQTIVFPPVSIGQTSESGVSLNNVTSSIMKWQIVSMRPTYVMPTGSTSYENQALYSAFVVDSRYGTLDPLQKKKVYVTFEPRDVGTFSQLWQVEYTLPDHRAGPVGAPRRRTQQLQFTAKGLPRMLLSEHPHKPTIGASVDMAVSESQPLIGPCGGAPAPPLQPAAISESGKAMTPSRRKKTSRNLSGQVTIASDVLKFAVASLDTSSVLKVSISNRAHQSIDMSVVSVDNPFSVRSSHRQFKLRARSCVRLPVHYQPTASGHHDGVLCLSLPNTDHTLQVQLQGSCATA